MTAQQPQREIPKRRKGADHFGYGRQVALGKNKDGDGLWHSHGKHYHRPDTYWCGNWGDRTPEELLSECESVIADMRLYHPDLFRTRPHTPAPKFSSEDLLLLAHDEWKRREERKHFHEEVPWIAGFMNGFCTSRKWAREYVDKLRITAQEEQ